ncbi:hypothetical protein [Falsiroseomonas sp. E2-1-a4]|uniref:hypothetical protein n=1 Tax=Falsiroseomonas sp. E2-1-a4 TaxID=3239299 RepID=UPI003F2C961A
MSVRNPQHPDPARVAALKAALERDLDRMLEWRGPVTEVRRLVAELDHLDAQFQRATARAAGPARDHMAN